MKWRGNKSINVQNARSEFHKFDAVQIGKSWKLQSLSNDEIEQNQEK